MPYKDPDRQRAYKREWAKLHRVGEGGTPCGTLLPLNFRVKTAQDVLSLLDEQVNAVRNDKHAATLEKARCIGYLAATMLKAVEQADLAARIEALEEVFSRRNVV